MANKDLEEIQKDLKEAEDRLKEILEEHGTGAHDVDVPDAEEDETGEDDSASSSG